MACDTSFIDTLRELEKGALFWEDGALQAHDLATTGKKKGPFL